MRKNATLLKRLKQYSALASPLMAIAGVSNAQIVYTDIDPDVVLSSPGDEYQLDLNNDGNVDFVFKSQTYGGTNWYREAVGPYPYSTGNTNGLQGTFNIPGSATVWGYPYAVAFGEPIDADQPFFQLSDLLFSVSGNGYFAFPALLSVYSGGPYGHWTDGVVDHYVGMRFSDGTNTYYGWARCDVSDDAKEMTIKDYAYNSTPNEGLTGGEGSPTGIAQVSNSSAFGIFGFEGVANIIIKDGKYDNAVITVTNMMGQQVVNQAVIDRMTRIDLTQFGKGMYMVTIQRGSEQFSRKVSFR